MALNKFAIAAGLVALVVLVIVLTRNRGPKVPTAAELAAMTQAELAAIDPEVLAKVDLATIAALTSGQIQAFTTTQIGALTGPQIGALTPEHIEALTAPSLVTTTPSAINSIRPEILALLPATTVGAFTKDQIANLFDSQINKFTFEQIEALTTVALNSSDYDVARRIDTRIFAKISPSKLSVLSIPQIFSIRDFFTYLTEPQLSALKNAPVLTALTESSLKALDAPLTYLLPILGESQVRLIALSVWHVPSAVNFIDKFLSSNSLASVEKVAWIDTSMIVGESCDYVRTTTDTQYPSDVKAAFLDRCALKNL